MLSTMKAQCREIHSCNSEIQQPDLDPQGWRTERYIQEIWPAHKQTWRSSDWFPNSVPSSLYNQAPDSQASASAPYWLFNLHPSVMQGSPDTWGNFPMWNKDTEHIQSIYRQGWGATWRKKNQAWRRKLQKVYYPSSPHRDNRVLYIEQEWDTISNKRIHRT